jgi:hypothetical protein
VDVDVHIGHPLGAPVEQARDGDRRIVVDAEAGRAARHRVMQATGDVDRAGGRTGPDGLGRRDARAADAGGSLVHAVEDGVVGGVEAPAAEERVDRGAPDRVEIVRAMDACEIGLGRRLGRDHADARAIEDAQFPGQSHGELDAHGIERVFAHVVVEQGPVPHHRGRRINHDGHAATLSARDRHMDGQVGFLHLLGAAVNPRQRGIIAAGRAAL